ncbi:MAG: radical SAM/SPASM domain-containing protein [Bacteroidales bacterium]
MIRNYLRAPIFVWWDITYACNLRCKQCYSNSGKPAPNELSTPEAKELIRQLAQMKVFYIYFLGGEPLLRPDFFELAKYAHDSGIEIMMSTNGWFVTSEIASRIEEAGFMHVRVSLDGATAETHDSIRGVRGSFERAVRALKILRKTSIPRLGISPTVLTENADEIAALIELAVSLDLDEMQIVQLCRTGRGSRAIAPNSVQLQKVKEVFEDYRERFSGILNLTATEGISMDTSEPGLCSVFSDFWGCPAGRTCVAIEAEGTIQPCILYGVSAGNVRQASFYDIWNHSPLFQKMRQVPTECSECLYARICSGDCPIEGCADKLLREQFLRQTKQKSEIGG